MKRLVPSSSHAAGSGHAGITAPAGHVFGHAISIWIMGGAWSRRRLTGIARAFEQPTKTRSPLAEPGG